VQKNARLARGQTIGTVGLDPTGRRAELYFELRIDGRPVDPLQWLKSRP
jgi:septal ring factor EnvC (AmiA/AmiB activator)